MEHNLFLFSVEEIFLKSINQVPLNERNEFHNVIKLSLWQIKRHRGTQHSICNKQKEKHVEIPL